MDESDAVAAFERLGLTSYDAKVFIALQRLGSGTARDVSRVTDVPRSQVYSVGESLADRGLVEIQQSSPMRYRPVSVESARSTLQDRFEREQTRAFEYVESVRRDREDEQREDIWTIRGQGGVTDRVVELVGEAERRVVFGAPRPELVPESIQRALAERADEGLTVTVVSEDPDVRAIFADSGGIAPVAPPPFLEDADAGGRLLYADDDVVLVSVFGSGDDPDRETAVWSAHSQFATVLIQMIEVGLQPGN